MKGAVSDGFPALVAVLIAHKPDVLVAVTTNAALAVHQATTTIPNRVHGRDGPR